MIIVVSENNFVLQKYNSGKIWQVINNITNLTNQHKSRKPDEVFDTNNTLHSNPNDISKAFNIILQTLDLLWQKK